MIDPTEIKVCGTCTDLLSLQKAFEGVHRLALTYAPHLDAVSLERKFNVLVIFTDNSCSVSVTPVESDEGNS